MNKSTASRLRLLGASSLLLISSFFFQYWEIEFQSPGNGPSTRLEARVGQLQGPPASRLSAAGRADLEKVEASSRVAAGVAVAFLCLAAAGARRRWSILWWLPAIVYPAALLHDTVAAVSAHGCALAGLPETCQMQDLPLFGWIGIEGLVGRTAPGAGAFLALAASLLLAAGLFSSQLRKGNNKSPA